MGLLKAGSRFKRGDFKSYPSGDHQAFTGIQSAGIHSGIHGSAPDQQGVAGVATTLLASAVATFKTAATEKALVRMVRATGTNWLTVLTPELTPLRGARFARRGPDVTAAVTAKQGVSSALRNAISGRCGAANGYGQGYGPDHEGAGQQVES